MNRKEDIRMREKRIWMISILLLSMIGWGTLTFGQALSFPAGATPAQPGDYVLAPNQDAATITAKDTVIFYTYEMVTPGETESLIKDPFKERTLPNSLIMPIPPEQTAAVGAVVLTWWQSGSGMQRGYVVNADNPQEPVVKYLDLDYDNPATNKDGVPIGQMDEPLKPDSFVKIAGDFAPGTAIAVKDKQSNRYTHYQAINVIGNQVIALGFAGKMAIFDKAQCLPVPVVPKVKADEKAFVKWMSSFSEVTIKQVDTEIGRVLTEDDEMIAFGDVLAPVQMAQDFLTRLGYDPGPVDGVMGQKTGEAIRAFQQAMSLPEDGQTSLDLVVALYAQVTPPAPEPVSDIADTPASSKRVEQPASPKAFGDPLSNTDIVQMIQSKGYHHPQDYSGSGLSGSVQGTFVHQYEAQSPSGAPVVVDHATGLMWKPPTDDLIAGPDVQAFIDQVNEEAYAGFSDWRLPTIEELAALLPFEMNSEGVYIDEEFPGVMWNVLSASPVQGDAEKAWGLDVYSGAISDFYLDDDFTIVLVRPL